MARYTIGYYDDGLVMGGTSRYLIELLDSLDRDQFHPVFFGLEPLPWHAELTKRNVELVYLYPASGSSQPEPSTPAPARKPRLPKKLAWWLGLVKDTRELVSLFKKRPVDLLHSDNSGAEPAPVAARLAGVPRILATWHVDSAYDFGQRSDFRYRFLEKQCLRAQHRAIAPSQYTKDDWVRRVGFSAEYASRVKVIFYGVHLNRLERRRSLPKAKAFLGIPDTLTVVGSLGRLEQAKGYEFLIRAIPAILKQAPQTLFVIAGKGPLEAELKAQAEQLGVAGSVRFIGFLNEIRDLLECSDIYVQPSLCEVTPMGILEASGLCLPVAASTVGGIPEMIIDNETGLLFPPRDPEKITASLVKLLTDAGTRARLGTAARERVAREFSPAGMRAATQELYMEMLAKN